MRAFLDNAAALFRTAAGRRRLLMALVGVTVLGFGVSLCRMADWGVDPFQSLCFGIYGHTSKIPLDNGTVYVLINLAFLIFALIFDRKQIGIGTFINMFLLGYVCDFGENALVAAFGKSDLIYIKLIWLILGIAVLCFSCSLYMTAALGVSTYDFVSIRLSNITPIPFRYMRILCDSVCVAVGWILGNAPGVTTVICALAMGPIISWINQRFSVPLLEGRLFRK